jgi:hypothetical protein
MTRGAETGGQGVPPPTPSKAEKARIGRRVRSINRHRTALEAALVPFGEELEPETWQKAFTSSDPEQTNRAIAVTANYSSLINNYVELLKAGARLAGLVAGRRPRAEEAIRAIQADDGLTAKQASEVQTLYRLEGRLEHASPDVQADEVRAAILTLRNDLPELVERALVWLGKFGIDLSIDAASGAFAAEIQSGPQLEEIRELEREQGADTDP